MGVGKASGFEMLIMTLDRVLGPLRCLQSYVMVSSRDMDHM